MAAHFPGFAQALLVKSGGVNLVTLSKPSDVVNDAVM